MASGAKGSKWWWLLAVAAVAGGWYAYSQYGTKDETQKFRTAKVEKGALVATVAATGILNIYQWNGSS